MASMKEAGPDNAAALRGIFLSPLCLLLVCCPLGVLGGQLGLGDSSVFWLNFLAMIPLAKILGDATEELAACLRNDMLSGLLNATFGNAVEMIMTVAFLRTHYIHVHKYVCVYIYIYICIYYIMI